jgi:hypothetical protein
MVMTLTPITTPVYPEMMTHPLWRYFYGHYKGVSLIREAGVWSEVEYVDADRIAAADAFLQGGMVHEFSDGVNLMRTGNSWEDGESSEYTIDGTAEVVASDTPFGSNAIQITPGDFGAGFWLNVPGAPGGVPNQTFLDYAAPVSPGVLYTVTVAAKRISATQADDDGFFFGVECLDSAGDQVADFATRAIGSAGRGQDGSAVDGTSTSYVDYLVNGELDPATDPDVWNTYTFPVMMTNTTAYVNFEVGSSNRSSFVGNVDAVWQFDNLSVTDGVGRDPYIDELTDLGYEVV